MNAPKVSILVPIYNVERYLEQCLDALLAQTLDDIEIIAINDGSTDSSGDILARYAAQDSRIRVIDKTNSGYGSSMNRGLAEACGKYVGIVEPDDYPDAVMFEKLFNAAEKGKCDLVKCNFYEHYEDHEDVQRVFDEFSYGKVFDPADVPAVICTIPAIWAALYRREMIETAGIRFRETPGASFQDTSFTLKAWFAARRAVLVRRPLLHYRMDNAGSSVKTADKAFVVCDELAEAERFLRAQHERRGAFMPWFNVDKWGKYRWNYLRIDESLRLGFAQRMRDEFAAANGEGSLAPELFAVNSRLQVAQLLVEGPDAFVERYPDGFPDDWEREADPGEAEEAARLFATMQVGASVSPALTVMVAAYDCEQFIGECLDSLKAQTFVDFEVIVVDDASTDATVDRAREAAAGDDRFSLVELSENGGPAIARNEALSRARGEYVMYVDADDMLAPDAIEKALSRARRQDLDELYFSATSFYEDVAATRVMHEDFGGRTSYDGVATGRELFTFFSDRGQYFTQGALRMARRSLIEREGVRFPEGIIHEDVLYGFRIMVASRRSSFLNEPIYLRRQRVGSIMDSSRRSVENVRGHVTSVLEVRRWMREHAAELDADFARAVGREVGLWSQLAAHDWECEMTESERAAFLESLDEDDLMTVLFDVLGMGSASERAAAEWRESMTYRLGDAIATVPRQVRDRAGAVIGKLKMRGRL